MKKQHLILILAAVFLFKVASSNPGDPTGASPVVEKSKEQLVEHIHALNRLLFSLAAERYSASGSKDKLTILTTHQGRRVRKYTDNSHLVVSLPLVEPSDQLALSTYTEQFNSFHINASDSKVQQGKYREVRELYQVLLRFAPQNGLYREVLEKRLALLDKLEKGLDAESSLRQFMEFKEFYGEPSPIMDFTDIAKSIPIVVTNLLEVRLP